MKMQNKKIPDAGNRSRECLPQKPFARKPGPNKIHTLTPAHNQAIAFDQNNLYTFDAAAAIAEAFLRQTIYAKCMAVCKNLHVSISRFYSVTMRGIKPISSYINNIIPPHGTADVTKAQQKKLIALAVIFSVIITYAFGETTAHYLPHQIRGNAGLKMLAIAGTGWLVQISAALFFMPNNRRLSYIACLGLIMLAGVCILLPSLFAGPLTGYNYAIVPIISVVLSSLIMLRLHYVFSKKLRIKQLWTLAWFAALQVTAVFWVYIFYFK